MPTIEIYTQPNCPFCIRAVALLQKKGVVFEEINAPRGTPERERTIQRSGKQTVPQVFVDDQSLGGCDDLLHLDRAGKLDRLLGCAE